MSLFHHMKFSQTDPLADGLADEIRAEQSEAEAFVLSSRPDAEDLVSHLSEIVDDLKNDPTWFDFSKD